MYGIYKLFAIKSCNSNKNVCDRICKKSFLFIGRTKEELESDQKIEFDKGKKLSDFIGMLVRIGFVCLAFLFLQNASMDEKSDRFIRFVLGVGSLCALSLYILMIWRICGIILTYSWADIAYHQNKWIKAFIVVCSLWITFVAIYSISYLAFAIAKANSILH